MISIVQLKTNEDFSALEQEWNPLLQQSPVDDAFLSWEWIHTWWKHYGHSYQLCLLVAREDDRLVGIAPLMLETQRILGFKIRVLRNIGIPTPDVGGIIIQNGREDVLKRIALWLVENQEMWDVLLIGEIPPDGMNFDAWIAKFSTSKFSAQVDTTRHFYILMDGGWNSYYQGLSKNLRKDMNKKIRHLQKGNGYHYYHKLGQDATFQNMETVFRINKNARHVYLYRDQTEREFHIELAELMADQGWLDLHFLYIGDSPVAFRYGFRYNQAYEAWRSGFDEAYFQYSPSKVLLYLLIQDGFEHGLKILDFLQGDEDFKLIWQVETRLFLNVRIVCNKPLPLFVNFYFPRFKRYMKDFLNRHQKLHPLLKAIEVFVNLKQNRQWLPQSTQRQINQFLPTHHKANEDRTDKDGG